MREIKFRAWDDINKQMIASGAWDAAHSWCLWEFDRSPEEAPSKEAYLSNLKANT